MQSLSRTLKEEVTFDRDMVTSLDWRTYPVARASDIPDQVDIILINRPDFPQAARASPRPGPRRGNCKRGLRATGVRMRQAPLTPARAKAALDGRATRLGIARDFPAPESSPGDAVELAVVFRVPHAYGSQGRVRQGDSG